MKVKAALVIGLLPTLMGFQQQAPPEPLITPSIIEVSSLKDLGFQQHEQQPVTKIFSDIKVQREKEFERLRQIEIAKEKQLQLIELHKEQLIYEKNNVHFNSMNVTEKSNISAETLRKGLPDNMKQMAESIIQVEKEYGVNAIFISAVAKHESGNGTSRAFQYLNNAFGIGPNRYFGSYDKAVEYFGNLMDEFYLQPNAQYYNGKSISGIAVVYCQDGTDWSSLVTQNAHDIIDKIKTTR